MAPKGCCAWMCCGGAASGDEQSAATYTKADVVANGTEMHQMSSGEGVVAVGDTPAKQAETMLTRCVLTNGCRPRTPIMTSERLLTTAAPAGSVGDVSVASAETSERQPLIVDPVIQRRLAKLRAQDPLNFLDSARKASAGEEQRKIATLRFAHGFYRGEQQWLSEALHMVERAVAVDVLLPVDDAVRYSSSVVDLADIVAQVKRIPPENYSNKRDIEKLLTDICRCCTYYAEEILKRTAYENDSLEVKQVQHLCVSVSNVEQARTFLLQQLCDLHLDNVAAACTDTEDVTALQEALADTVEDSTNTLAVHLCNRIDFIAGKVVCGVQRVLLEPQQLGGEHEAWLLHMDNMLTVLFARLNPKHLHRLLDTCWDSFEPTVKQAIKDHLYEPASWFRRLQDECHQLVEFVSRADERTAEEGCPVSRVREAVDALLQPYMQDAHQLLHTARLRRNLELAACEADTLLGNLGVRALRAPDKDGHTLLSVQIMHATRLHPALSKKLYVKLKFSPKEQFKGVQKCKTKHCKKDVPLFESLFTVRLPPAAEDALLMFVVKKVKKLPTKPKLTHKDKRTLAMAYLPLCDVPLVEEHKDAIALERQSITYLPLGEPGKSDPEIVKVLTLRKQSKKTKKILKKDIRIV